MRYVGIDPSTKTGMLCLHDSGAVIFQSEIEPKTTKEPERFLEITKEVLLRLMPGDVICIEGFSYGSKGQGVSTQYGIGWLIRAELIKNGYTYYEASPNAVKKFATGTGNIKKENMVLPIYKRWGFEHSSDNVRDAFVLAQIAKALHEKEGLTNFQIEVLEKVR